MKKFLLSLVLVASVALGYAQVTTSSISGTVRDERETVPGASVKATHTPSGTVYTSSTNENGRFTLANLRVGGPYTVEVTYIGSKSERVDGIMLTLGEPYTLNVNLTAESQVLSEVIVTGSQDNVLNSSRTGASTTISRTQVQTLPTISRGFNDFVRLTPQADVKGSAISIGGINNRFNQVTIDGAVSNDVFGLSETGTNGGGTGTSPISLDAIDQFTVQIAPFDVRAGGFAGGGISAVTRSGTNDVQASAYYYFRNQSLAGKTPGQLLQDGDARERFPDFSEKQFGARIGGPLIKDKLFLFLNAEKTESNTPLSFAPGQDGSNFTVDQLERVAAAARSLGYEPGSFMDQEATSQSEKIFARLDWNINEKHKLTARYSYTKGQATDLSRSPNAITFSNGAVLRQSTTNSAVLELNSRFSNELSNNLIAGYTAVRDPRSAPGDPFPRVTIELGGQPRINLGTEAFSTVNQLNQDIITLTDNLTWYKGKHTFTFGTHNEFYKMYNAFIGNAYGTYTFAPSSSESGDLNPVTGAPYTGIENFERGLARAFNYQYSRTADPREGARFNAMQLGFYVQDEYQVTDDLKITGGVRLDVPIYLDEPLENPDFNSSVIAQQYDVRTNRMPKPAFMFSPRVGFNWDVMGDRSTQLRGGVGIFTSRFPFVWAGGAFTQSGMLLDANQLSVGQNSAPNIPFNPDPFNQPKRTTESQPGGNITVIEENFKLPQILRANIGLDQRLPWGIIGTAEFMYSKNINAFRFRDLNLADPIGRLEGADDRLVYAPELAGRKVLQNYTQIVHIDNVNEGYSWSATGQLQKAFNSGFYGSVAYTYTKSEDLFPGTSSQNQSNFYRVATVDGSNNATLGFSPFNVGSRIVAALSYRKEYVNHLGTTVSLFYTGQSGTPFSYTVNGDLTRSTAGGSSDFYSLMYIPRNASEMRFAQNGDVTPEQQWDQFNAFIESQPYLSERRGQYAERNGARTPFTHQFDVKVLQDIFTNIGGKRNTLQISIDIMNFGALLNKDWGTRYAWGTGYFDNAFQPVNLSGFDGNTPVYTLGNLNNNQPWTVSDHPQFGSRWSAQIGVRYIFN